MPKVEDYFVDNPFLTTAGVLAIETGKDDFVQLKVHGELLKQTEAHLKERPITIRIIASGIGGGKTWTLSWLYRHYDDTEDTFAIAVPRLELRGQPERGLVEAIFRGLKPSIEKIRAKLESPKAQLPKRLLGTAAEYVWNAILDPEAFSLLTGGGGRLPALGNVAPPILTKTEGTLRLLLGLLQVLKQTGFAKVIILVDEVESLFLTYGRRDLFIFSNFVRGIIDEFQTDNARSLPRLVMLLAGTGIVLQEISPGLVGRQMDEQDIAASLVRRLSPPYQLFIQSESDVLEIASYRIGEHKRKREPGRPYIPYDKEAILFVWKNFQNLGDFCRGLQEMYEEALAERVDRITLKHAKKVVQRYL